MASRYSSESLARYCAIRPKRVAAVWFALLVVGVVVTMGLCSTSITNSDGAIREVPESVKAENLIAEHFGDPNAKETQTEIFVVRSSTFTVDDSQFSERVESVFSRIEVEGARVDGGDPVVANLVSYFATGDPSLVSEDRKTTIGYVVLSGDVDHVIDTLPPIQEIVDELNESDEFEAYLVGNGSFSTVFNEIAERDLVTGEGIGLLVAMVILVIVFRALGAAPIPIMMAIVTIIMAISAAMVIGQLQPVSFFIINMITMIGLAVGIDYSLFIVSRYREERRAGVDKVEAIARSGATASRAVFFSGLTVVIALLGMLVVPASIYFSLGLGAILAAVMAVIGALTLLPAFLSLAGDRVNAISISFPG